MRERGREESAARRGEKKKKAKRHEKCSLGSGISIHALLVRVAFNDGPLRLLLFQLVGLSILRVTTVYFIAIPKTIARTDFAAYSLSLTTAIDDISFKNI